MCVCVVVVCVWGGARGERGARCDARGSPAGQFGGGAADLIQQVCVHHAAIPQPRQPLERAQVLARRDHVGGRGRTVQTPDVREELELRRRAHEVVERRGVAEGEREHSVPRPVLVGRVGVEPPDRTAVVRRAVAKGYARRAQRERRHAPHHHHHRRKAVWRGRRREHDDLRQASQIRLLCFSSTHVFPP